MKRKSFLRNVFFAALSPLASKIPFVNTLSAPDNDLMIYAQDTAFITRQIARYNKRFIEDLDKRIFEILGQKVKSNLYA